MTIQKDNLVEAKDVNEVTSDFKDKVINYEIKRQALSVQSVWKNTTPDPIPPVGQAPTPVVYDGSFSFSPLPAKTDHIISGELMNQLATSLKDLDKRLQQEISQETDPKQISPTSIIGSGELLDNYTDTEITAETFNVLLTILTRANNILSQYDYYTSYIVQRGTCKRTCQVSCQTRCQLSCQGYHSCHNQKCGAH